MAPYPRLSGAGRVRPHDGPAALRIPLSYPDDQIDMVYFSPALALASGRAHRGPHAHNDRRKIVSAVVAPPDRGEPVAAGPG